MMPKLWDAWNEYYQQPIFTRERGVCFVSGNEVSLTDKHPGNINRLTYKAKLISSNAKKNDTRDFVYRGRFASASKAVTVSYEASQKAHQALRWLIANQGYRCDTQVIVAWAIDEKPELPSYADDSFDIYSRSKKVTSADILTEVKGTAAYDYAVLMKKTLDGFAGVDKMKSYRRRVAIMATDSATTGRMSITYYRELSEREYLERVADWHDTCKWYQPFGKDKDDKQRTGYFIGAPSMDRITAAVLGKRRHGKDTSYDKCKKAAREQLLHCVFDGERTPRNMVDAVVHSASHPLALEKTGENDVTERWREWEQVLCVACALVKRYYRDYKKEEYEVALEEGRRDRNYLYGRLLAVADKIESAARHKQGKTKEDARATNAIRYMAAFSHHPLRTWNTLWEQLNPYIQQLDGAGWYQNIIEDILEKFMPGDYESDAALNGVYLLGYFAQRRKLREKTVKTADNGGAKDEPDKQN
jgi:CRISPR-associated protein Csd1